MLWSHTSLTCHTSLTSSHRSPVLLRALLSPLLWMTAAVTSFYCSRFPIFLPSLHPTPRALVPCACEGMHTSCATLHNWTCLGCERLFALFSLLSKKASSALRTAPKLGRRREIQKYLVPCCAFDDASEARETGHSTSSLPFASGFVYTAGLQ